MKSLEHIIRDIREGKSTEKGEKTSLEHSIRKVVKGEAESSFADRTTKPLDEAVGIIGTDKYQGNEFKSIRTATPHIKPPAGEGSHSQAPENASRQRSIAKEKAGINRVTEEELAERSTQAEKNALRDFDPSNIDAGQFLSTPLFTTGAGASAGGVKGKSTKAGQPARKVPEPTTPSIPKGPPIQIPGGKPSPVRRGPQPTETPANEPGKETPVVPKPKTPDGTPPTKVPAPEVPKPANVPEPAKPSKAPSKPAAPAPETPTPASAPRELPKTIPGVVPGGLPLPVPFSEPKKETKPETSPKTEPKPQALPVIDVPAASPATKAEPATKTEPAPKLAAEPATTPVTKTETTPKTASDAETTTPTETKKKMPSIGLPMMASADVFGGQRGIASKHPTASKARAHRRHVSEEVTDKIRKKIQNAPRLDAGDRKSIEYVGRSDSDPKSAKEKTSRLATIKNVIDEAKKIKVEAESGKEKKMVYPNGTEVVIGPDMKYNRLDVEDQKLPKDHDNK